MSKLAKVSKLKYNSISVDFQLVYKLTIFI